MGDNPVLLFWLAIFGVGLIGMAFKAWQLRRIRAGQALPGQHEVAWRNVICSVLTAGFMGMAWEVIAYARDHANPITFIIGCVIFFLFLLSIGALVDRRNGRAAP